MYTQRCATILHPALPIRGWKFCGLWWQLLKTQWCHRLFVLHTAVDRNSCIVLVFLALISHTVHTKCWCERGMMCIFDDVHVYACAYNVHSYMFVYTCIMILMSLHIHCTLNHNHRHKQQPQFIKYIVHVLDM